MRCGRRLHFHTQNFFPHLGDQPLVQGHDIATSPIIVSGRVVATTA